MADAARPTPQAVPLPARRTWSLPVLRELPKLTELTLASPIGGGGGTGGSGSTVFALWPALLSLALLPACFADRETGPGGSEPTPLATVSCQVEVATKVVTCAGPKGAPGQEIIGGQGLRVLLASTGVGYNGTTHLFEFDVTVKNLTSMTLGSDGTTTTGVKVFFTAPPVAFPGPATITVVGGSTEIFLGSSQDFYLYNQLLAPGATSTPVHWALLVPAGVTSFSFTVLVAADVPSVGEPLLWTEVPGFNHRIRAITGNGSGAMAVGDDGAGWTLSGAGWLRVQITVPQDLVGVGALGGGNYLAAGSDGWVRSWNGTSWQPNCQGSPGLAAFSVGDVDHWLAAGGDQVLVHYPGNCSELHLATLGRSFKFVSAGPAGNFLAMTEDGHYFRSSDGVTWSGLSSLFPTDGVARTITGAFLDQDDDIIWSFRSGAEPYGAVVRNSSDTLVGGVLDEIPDAILPMGADGRDSLLVALYDGVSTTFRKVVYGGTPTSADLASISSGERFRQLSNARANGSEYLALTDSSHLFRVVVAGGLVEPQLLAEVGPSYSYASEAVSLWNRADTLFVTSDMPGVYRVTPTGTLFNPIPYGSAALGTTSVSGFGGSETTIRVIKRGSFEVYQSLQPWVTGGWGAGAWPSIHGTNATALACEPVDGGCVAVGPSGFVVHNFSDLVTFEFLDAPYDAGYRGDGTAVWVWESFAYVTTMQGELYFWDLGAVPFPFGVDPEFSDFAGLGPLYAVAGTGRDDVWVAGSGGRIYHWDGTEWTDLHAVNVPTFDIHSLATIAPGAVYAGSTNGLVARYSTATVGTAVPHYVPGLPHEGTITDIARLSNGTVYVGGKDFLYRGIQ